MTRQLRLALSMHDDRTVEAASDHDMTAENEPPAEQVTTAPGSALRESAGIAGLSDEEAARRLARDGRNALPVGRPDTLGRAVVRQLADTVVVVLLVAALLTVLVGDLSDTAVILAVILLNTALGVSQERRSDRALAELADLTAPQAAVQRSGQRREIDAREVVRGDVVILAAGDIVPADLTLSTTRALQADESSMTGESVPVDKGTSDMLLAGSVITRGSGCGTVTATGADTALAGIAREVAIVAPSTPLQRQLSTLGHRLAFIVALAALAVMALALAAGRSLDTSLVIGLSLAVAAIPESLPAVVSLSLALGARRMSARGVLTRRLSAVEALGSVTVVATDKTGTLTTGAMQVTGAWWPAGGSRDVLYTAAVLCNDAAAGPTSGSRDDPTETALVAAAAQAGIDVQSARSRYPRVAEEPFDAAAAQMITTHSSPDAAERGVFDVVKGSPEAVAALLADGPTAADLAVHAAEYAAAGARVLAIADRRRPAGWRLLGIVSMTDPVRPTAPSFVDAFHTAGVRTVMITGDHPDTAAAIGAAVGIDSIHARTPPERKADILADLQHSGEVVAMTGDGVNDAPALRRADIGVAMGRRGTEVAKQAADLVLTGDDLSALQPAIGEGRRMYDNLRRFLRYALAGGLAEVLIMLLGPAVGLAVPLRAGQILWVNLLTHGLPGVAMGNEPAEPDVLRRPPRLPAERLLDRDTAVRVAVLGGAVTTACLLAAVASRRSGGHWQSLLFATLIFAQLAIALAVRPRHTRPRDNPLLPLTVIINVALALAALYWAPLQDLLHTTALTGTELAVAVGAAAAVGIVAAVQQRIAPRAPRPGFAGPSPARRIGNPPTPAKDDA